jgi:hypothetical protein
LPREHLLPTQAPREEVRASLNLHYHLVDLKICSGGNTPMQCLLKCAKLSLVITLATFAFPSLTPAQHNTQKNLISDIPDMAPKTDPNLKNPWGLTRSPTVQPSGAVGSPWWIANNNSGSNGSRDERDFANFANGM